MPEPEEEQPKAEPEELPAEPEVTETEPLQEESPQPVEPVQADTYSLAMAAEEETRAVPAPQEKHCLPR